MNVRALLQLLRPANVVTALADVLAGIAVAGLAVPNIPWWLLGSTVCLYAGGIVLNDFFDRNLDAIERPERPIPSGRISSSMASAFGFVLLGVGICLAAMVTTAAALVAIAISACVLLYDIWGKHQRFFGPVNMGACRGLNLVLGMVAVPSVITERGWLAMLPLIYIAAVTAVSRGEVRGGKREVAALSIGAIVVVLANLVFIGVHSIAALVVTALLAIRVLPPFVKAWKEPVPLSIRGAVRAGVLSLVLLEAAIGASYGGILYCLIILTIAVIAAGLAGLFAVT